MVKLLFHNFPLQRTLLITHSNHGLNDIFHKIMKKGIPSKYLLRLGVGEEELEMEQSFSRIGRVNAIMKRRLELLTEIERLAKILIIPEMVNNIFTCETAENFWLLHVLP